MINARLAIITDSKDIFEWRNDELTRQMSYTSDVVGWDGHSNWFAASLKNKNRFLLMCEEDSSGEKVAVIRFDIENDNALISINISPKVRGRGLAKICLSTSISFFKSKFPLVQHIFAEIKLINEASSRAFKGVGFILKEETNDIKTYEYVFKE